VIRNVNVWRVDNRIHRNSPCGRVLGREPVDVRYEVVEVPLSQITDRRHQKLSTRRHRREFAMLLAVDRAQGDPSPCPGCRRSPTGGKVRIDRGVFRRFRAACELGLSTLLVKVYPIHFIAEAYMINLAENFARKEIGPYALACQCRHLQEMRIPITKIAEEIGRTTGYLYAIMRYLDLPEAIVADWKNGHALLTLPRLQKLAAMPPKEATSLWLKVRARHLREESPSTKDPLKELVKRGGGPRRCGGSRRPEQRSDDEKVGSKWHCSSPRDHGRAARQRASGSTRARPGGLELGHAQGAADGSEHGDAERDRDPQFDQARQAGDSQPALNSGSWPGRWPPPSPRRPGRSSRCCAAERGRECRRFAP